MEELLETFGKIVEMDAWTNQQKVKNLQKIYLDQIFYFHMYIGLRSAPVCGAGTIVEPGFNSTTVEGEFLFNLKLYFLFFVQ